MRARKETPKGTLVAWRCASVKYAGTAGSRRGWVGRWGSQYSKLTREKQPYPTMAMPNQHRRAASLLQDHPPPTHP